MASQDPDQAGTAALESYSLWLMPSGELADKLSAEIGRLADTHAHLSPPRFAPHVTLLGDIQQPREQAVETAKKLAASLRPYRLSFLNATRGTFYYQCVFLLAAADPEVMAAAALARELYGMKTGPYMPHLSLLYADLSDGEKDQAAAAARGRLFGEGAGYETLLVDPGFTVTSLTLWSTPTDDKSTASWCKVAEFPLSG